MTAACPSYGFSISARCESPETCPSLWTGCGPVEEALVKSGSDDIRLAIPHFPDRFAGRIAAGGELAGIDLKRPAHAGGLDLLHGDRVIKEQHCESQDVDEGCGRLHGDDSRFAG